MAGIFVVHSRLGGMVLVLLAFLSSSTTPSAQVATGSIAGTVSDSTGQVVPGAQVTIREVSRNTTTTLVTDGSGVYTAPFLVPGTYEVQVELQGFKTWIRPGIILQVTGRVRVDVALEVGTIKRSTGGREPRSCAPIPRKPARSSRRWRFKELPLNGGNFATSLPGTGDPTGRPARTSPVRAPSPAGASNFNALGVEANSNAWMIDGIDNMSSPSTLIVMPSDEVGVR